MSQPIALFYLVKVGRNHGAGAFTLHLYKMLRLCGFDPTIYTVTERCRTMKIGEFGEGIPYFTVSTAGAVELSRQMRSIIAVSHSQHFPEETSALLRRGVPWVLHGTGNLPEHPDVLAAVPHAGVGTIRRALQRTTKARIGLDTVLVPHPYVMSGTLRPRSFRKAVSCSRVDFVKHTDMIIEANKMLNEGNRIEIYGEVNRMYAFHTLDKKHPGWRRDYKGALKLGEGLLRFGEAHFAVDLTYWKDDNGGTQYTFFEAWEAGTSLILHSNWYDADEPTSEAAIFVQDASHLAHAVLNSQREREDRCRKAGFDMLQMHSAENVIHPYMNLMG
jgi:hypothetical protein